MIVLLLHALHSDGAERVRGERRLATRLLRGAAVVLTIGGIALAILMSTGGDEKAPRNVAERPNPVPLSDGVMAEAAAAYRANCLACHGETGKGDGPSAAMQSHPPRDLTQGILLEKMMDGEIYWVISKGKKPVMPAFESKLTDEARWGLVHLMRTFPRPEPRLP